MAATGNEEVFRRFYGEAWNRGDLGVVDELLDEGFVNHGLCRVAPGGIQTGRRGDPRRLSRLDDRDRGRDLRGREGGGALALVRNPHGALPGLQPTGAPVRTRGITIVRIVDGRITDLWKQDDSHTVGRQLGAAPAAT